MYIYNLWNQKSDYMVYYIHMWDVEKVNVDIAETLESTLDSCISKAVLTRSP